MRLQETTESLTYRIMDRVAAVELLADTVHNVVRPFMREHNLNEERVLYQYIGDLISDCKGEIHTPFSGNITHHQASVISRCH